MIGWLKKLWWKARGKYYVDARELSPEAVSYLMCEGIVQMLLELDRENSLDAAPREAHDGDDGSNDGR